MKEKILISKSKIDKVGEILRDRPDDEAALDILAAWRNKHVYPLGLAFKLLKRQTDKVGNNAIYGQRLKRVRSILYKLKRLPQAKLSRINDIGGCRVILTDYKKLRTLYLELQKSRLITKYKDYITDPKADGYRSIHLIYKCSSHKLDYAGLNIEFQLRTKLQHAWATAVEIIDTFENEQLKLGLGSEKWRRFFYLVADEFAILEQLPLHDNKLTNRIIEIKRLCKELKVIEKLMGYTIVSKKVFDNNGADRYIENASFFILLLDVEMGRISIAPFKDQEDAQNFYITQEKKYINNPFMNVLMVKMDSAKQLRKSYPNYFADSKIFLEKLNTILK